jgi:hypothetical protein
MDILKNWCWRVESSGRGLPFQRASGFTRGGAVRQPKAGGLGGKTGASPVKNEPKYPLNRPTGLKPIEYSIEYSFGLPILRP